MTKKKPAAKKHVGASAAALGTTAEPPPFRPAVGRLHVPPFRRPEFLKTLAEWGRLDEIVPLPEMATLVALACRQDPAAVQHALGDEVFELEVPFWGLQMDGAWKEDFHRFMWLSKGPADEAEHLRQLAEHYTGRETPKPAREQLHDAAIGLRLRDVVDLLVRRKGRVPTELLDLLGEDGRPLETGQPGAASAPAQRVFETAAAAVLRSTGADASPSPPADPSLPRADGTSGWSAAAQVPKLTDEQQIEVVRLYAELRNVEAIRLHLEQRGILVSRKTIDKYLKARGAKS